MSNNDKARFRDVKALAQKNGRRIGGEDEEWLPGWMAQSGVVKDYRALELGCRRASRFLFTSDR
jgi:hypothetical protein